MMIHPVILCGGSGTRLWPLSRKDYPKQFSRLFGDESLFQASLARYPRDRFAPPIIITHADFRFLVAEQLSTSGRTEADILLEPEARNTGPAILAAALHLEAQGAGNDLMVVAPSDHVIRDVSTFQAAINAGADAARGDHLVTFGIRPDRAETGYGYLEVAEVLNDFTPRPIAVSQFVEKPDVARAEAMLKGGKHLWNAGIFLFRVKQLIAAFETHAPEALAPCRAAIDDMTPDLGFHRIGSKAFAKAPSISIDYAVMEKAARVTTVPLDCGWSDLGSWDAVWREMAQSDVGVASRGGVTEIDCRNTLLRSEEDGLELVGVGLEDIAVVAMRDAVLVARMDDVQKVKQAVSILKDRDALQAETFPRTYRPWGWYETLSFGGRFQVKQIMVNPGSQLSLQSHLHRSEHWVVVAGTAEVTRDGETSLLSENQSIYIPLGSRHRLSNPGKLDLHLIEVQTGAYLGEDDITGFEDAYNRV